MRREAMLEASQESQASRASRTPRSDGRFQDGAAAGGPGGEGFDLAVIGGGATGLGIALDAATRGHRVVLLERADFGQETSSRSTKLVHGGVRYLEQGNVRLVHDALLERDRLRRNAPHLVEPLRLVVPGRSRLRLVHLRLGLALYDGLAGGLGRTSFPRSRSLGRRAVLEALPGLRRDGLRGGVEYHDGQFDDAGLIVALARTAADHGAILLNHVRVTGLVRDGRGRVAGVEAEDLDGPGSPRPMTIRARVVVNATGPEADAVRRMAAAGAEPMIAPSRGSHVVLGPEALGGRTGAALLVPRTADGRVLFAIPWQGVVIAGTTDVAVERAAAEPRATSEEIDFILETLGRELDAPVERSSIRSVFAGVRPLVRAPDARRTASLARDHVIEVDGASGLVTIAGGKWTTYRRMAEDAVNRAEQVGGLERRPCRTRDLPLRGAGSPTEPTESTEPTEPTEPTEHEAESPGRRRYGTDLASLEALERERPELARPLDPRLPLRGSEVRWACEHEMARRLEDVLARRSRSLVLDARAARDVAPAAAAIMAEVLGRDQAWIDREVEAFGSLADAALPGSSSDGDR